MVSATGGGQGDQVQAGTRCGGKAAQGLASAAEVAASGGAFLSSACTVPPAVLVLSMLTGMPWLP